MPAPDPRPPHSSCILHSSRLPHVPGDSSTDRLTAQRVLWAAEGPWADSAAWEGYFLKGTSHRILFSLCLRRVESILVNMHQTESSIVDNQARLQRHSDVKSGTAVSMVKFVYSLRLCFSRSCTHEAEVFVFHVSHWEVQQCNNLLMH